MRAASNGFEFHDIVIFGEEVDRWQRGKNANGPYSTLNGRCCFQECICELARLSNYATEATAPCPTRGMRRLTVSS
jgi:hypothetical protein